MVVSICVNSLSLKMNIVNLVGEIQSTAIVIYNVVVSFSFFSIIIRKLKFIYFIKARNTVLSARIIDYLRVTVFCTD